MHLQIWFKEMNQKECFVDNYVIIVDNYVNNFKLTLKIQNNSLSNVISATFDFQT